jgi:hypothetical protein
LAISSGFRHGGSVNAVSRDASAVSAWVSRSVASLMVNGLHWVHQTKANSVELHGSRADQCEVAILVASDPIVMAGAEDIYRFRDTRRNKAG